MEKGMDVAIIGAGGFGREVFQYCNDAQAAGWQHRVQGFVDDKPDILDSFDLPIPILGGLSDLKKLEVRGFIIALGKPELRRKVADAVAHIGGVLVSLVHPSAYVASTAQVDSGVIICPFTVIAANAVVGDNVVVNAYASVGHDSNVGKDSVLSPYSAVAGGVCVGAECFLGIHSSITPGTKIGRRTKVSAGSTVTHDAEAGSLLVGNPATGRVMFSLG